MGLPVVLMMLSECPHCNDSEGFPIQLDDDGFCPVCGEDFGDDLDK